MDLQLGGVDQLGLLRTEEACTSASVYSKLNALAPISSLPAEILEHIFGFCVSWIYGYEKTKHSLAWTQVCFSWRRISFNSIRLWQRIDLCNSRYANHFLVRSKEAPLSIVSTSPLKLTTDNLALHAGRLHSIDVFLLPDDMVHLFSSIGGSLKNLMHLSLKIPQTSSALFLDILLPRVRRLELDCITVPWNSCRNLTHLSLRGLDSKSCPSIPQMHQLFSQSPYIESIRLENFMPEKLLLDDNNLFLIQPFPFPHLKDMIISSEPLEIIALLSGMLISASCRLQLYCSFSESLQSIFPHGIPQMKTGHRLDASTIRLSRHGVRFILNKTKRWSEDLSRSLFSISSASHVAINVCKSLDYLLDASCVTSLELNTGVLFDIPNHDIHRLLSSLNNLETLSIAFNDLEEILKILSASPLNLLLCPRLVQVSFGKSDASMWFQFGERWLDSVINFARVRQRCSLPIHTFEFFQCHGVSQATVGKLQEIVPLVKISEFIANGGYY